MRNILLLGFVLIAVMVGGCQGADINYVNTMEKSLQVIIPHHIDYLKADAKLSELEREAMVKASQDVLDLAVKAKAEHAGQ